MSALTPAQIEGFLKLVGQLLSYRNRNSRVVGSQYKDFPPKDIIPEFYTKTDIRQRCLGQVIEALRAGRYEDASQVYSDIYWSFHGVAESVGRSTVTYRDARKMERMLDEYWTKLKTLPPLTSLDPAVLPAARSMSMDNTGDDSMSQSTSAHPSPAPQISTDHLHASMSMSPAPTAIASFQAPVAAAASISTHRPSPSLTSSIPVQQINSPIVQSRPTAIASSSFSYNSPAPAPFQQSMQMPSPVVAAHPPQHLTHLQHPSQQQAHLASNQYNAQMYSSPMAVFFPAPSGDQGIEIPLQIPPSVFSAEAKTKLQEEQDAIFAARAKLFKGKKRKREPDEVPDESSGWLDPRETGSLQKRFYLEVIARLKGEKEPVSGRSLAAPILNLPSHEKFPQFYQYIKDPHPPTLSSVEKHIRTNLVPDPSDFDAELCTIFANGRVWPAAGMNSSDGEALPPFYGDTLCLQRLYQEMTKGTGQIPGSDVQITDLASVPYGPGSIPLEVEEVAEGQTRLKMTMSSNRISTSQKTFLESVHYKGDEYSAGDFVHLFNPSNPRLPIIAQIFKCYRKNGTGDRYLTVNWYYRPCQTSHPEDRTFYEQEVFKSNLFIDHKLEDLIERVSVMHIADYTKGRFDYWDEDMPLYVVEHRWNVETNSFSKIKNWQLCIPEDSAPDPFSFRLFLDTVPAPTRIKSPFFRDSGITGPGQPGDSLVYEAPEQLAYYTPLKNWPEGTGGLTGYAKKMLTKKLADPIVPSIQADNKETDSNAPAQKRGKGAQRKSETPAAEAANEGQPTRENFKAITPVEHAALTEHFAPLAKEIVTGFRLDPATQGPLWFTAPPLEILGGPGKQTLHSLDYLAHMAKQLGY